MFTVTFINFTPNKFNLNIHYIFPILIRKWRIFRMKLHITARFLYVLVIEYSVNSVPIILNFNLENQSCPRILLNLLSLKKIFNT